MAVVRPPGPQGATGSRPRPRSQLIATPDLWVPPASVRSGITIIDPPDLAVTMSGQDATLTWSASQSGAASYDLYRRTPPTGVPFVPGTDTPVATNVTSPYSDTGLASGDYEWQVFGRVAGKKTITSVNTAQNRGYSTTTAAVSAGTVAVGDVIIVSGCTDGASATVSCSDSLSTTYSTVASWQSQAFTRVFCGVIGTAGTPTVTVTSTVSGWTSIVLSVFRGLDTTTPTYGYAQSVNGSYVTSWSVTAPGAVASGDGVIAGSFQAYGGPQVGSAAPKSHFVTNSYGGGFWVAAHEDDLAWGGSTPTATMSNDGSSGSQSGCGMWILGLTAGAA